MQEIVFREDRQPDGTVCNAHQPNALLVYANFKRSAFHKIIYFKKSIVFIGYHQLACNVSYAPDGLGTDGSTPK